MIRAWTGFFATASVRAGRPASCRYLVDRIEGLANIEVLTRAQVSGLEGIGRQSQTQAKPSGVLDEEQREASDVFTMGR